jgi:hypothetical protein
MFPSRGKPNCKVHIYLAASADTSTPTSTTPITIEAKVTKTFLESKKKCTVTATYTGQITTPIPDTLFQQIEAAKSLDMKEGTVIRPSSPRRVEQVSVQFQNTSSSTTQNAPGSKFVGVQLGAIIYSAADGGVTALVNVKVSYPKLLSLWGQLPVLPCLATTDSDDEEYGLVEYTGQITLPLNADTELLVASKKVFHEEP